MRLVVEQLCALEADGVLLRDAEYRLWSIKEPPAVVFPVVNVIGEVIIDGGANGIDIEHVRRFSPPCTTLDALCHVAHGDHVASVYRS